jgi:hypothetical protein
MMNMMMKTIFLFVTIVVAIANAELRGYTVRWNLSS